MNRALLVLVPFVFLALSSSALAQQFQCGGCSKLPPTYSGTPGPTTFSDGSQILLQAVGDSNGSCQKLSNDCIDDAPCSFWLQYQYSVEPCGGVASYELRVADADDPNNPEKNARVGGDFPSGEGSWLGQVYLYCAATLGFGIEINVNACPGNNNQGATRSAGVTLVCTPCGKIFF